MGQEEILKVLKKNPDQWFTVKQIQKHTNIGLNSVGESIRRMIKNNDIYIRKEKGVTRYYNLVKYK